MSDMQEKNIDKEKVEKPKTIKKETVKKSDKPIKSVVAKPSKKIEKETVKKIDDSSDNAQTKLVKSELKKIKTDRYYGTGKRKNAVARVWIYKSEGQSIFQVNKKIASEYLKTQRMFNVATEPLNFLDLDKNFSVMATVKGGGIAGQAGAIRAGVAKALVLYDEGLKSELKLAGFLTRDARIKERKHYGHKRARKSFQFSKR